eukprot:1195749-Prorocentrum_minimum.AAC.7
MLAIPSDHAREPLGFELCICELPPGGLRTDLYFYYPDSHGLQPSAQCVRDGSTRYILSFPASRLGNGDPRLRTDPE